MTEDDYIVVSSLTAARAAKRLISELCCSRVVPLTQVMEIGEKIQGWIEKLEAAVQESMDAEEEDDE